MRKPRANLGIYGGSHFEMTGRMSVAHEQLIVEERPYPVIVPSDVTSTLAGASAAAKLHIPAAHLLPDRVLATGACRRRSIRVLTSAPLLLRPIEAAVGKICVPRVSAWRP